MVKTIPCALLLCLVSTSSFAARPDAWVVVRGRDSASMHGDGADLEAARSHLGELGPGFLWFRRAGKEYLVRGESLKEVNELIQKQQALGAEQGRLGKAQGELGWKQGQLGREQALDVRNRDLGKQQAELGRQQAELGREQRALGEKQRDLSRQMQRKIEELIETSLKDGSAKPI